MRLDFKSLAVQKLELNTETVSLDSRVFSQNRPLLHSWRASKVWTAATEETQKCSHNPRNRYAEEQWKVRYTKTCIVYFSFFSFSFSSYFGFNCVLLFDHLSFQGLYHGILRKELELEKSSHDTEIKSLLFNIAYQIVWSVDHPQYIVINHHKRQANKNTEQYSIVK